MMAGLHGLIVAPSNPAGGTQAGQVVAQGIMQGGASGQLSDVDQENVLSAAATTPAGSALFTKNLAAAGAVGLVIGVAIGYYLKKRGR